MRIIFFIAAIFICSNAAAQAGTDIWLFQISKENGKLILKNGKNITARKGYDNQPHFSKDNKSVYFSSGRDSSGQTDIYRYDISTKKTKQITFTATSEFSPAITPNGNLSVVKVEEDKSQHIWEFHLKGNKKPRRLFYRRDSIGYYRWLNSDAVICFILGGKNNPNRLSVIDTTGFEKTIVENVGRGFAVTPDVVYSKPIDSGYYLFQEDWLGLSIAPRSLIKAPGKSQDLVLFENFILMGDESKIYAAGFSYEKGRWVQNVQEFKVLADLGSYPIKKITRLAISPDKKWIAIVAADD